MAAIGAAVSAAEDAVEAGDCTLQQQQYDPDCLGPQGAADMEVTTCRGAAAGNEETGAVAAAAVSLRG